MGWTLQKGWFYETGAQWFDSCWAQVHANGRSASTPEEAVTWAQCEPIAQKAVYGAGYIFSGLPEKATTPQLKAIGTACPSNWTDMPLGGMGVLAVDLVEKQGGPQLLDRFLPANHLIVHAFEKQWPQCPSVRVSNGFPKVVQQADGAWKFESHCIPCEAETHSQ
ncbi:hypothetical protein [Burkholderia multivorans]|uniref:hypothetical protein n=1 Tax=Burkholderia multivorans TaxID=87883 RepID=UPI00209DD478|nr:hypothetical protein [Burkholderia multivorans]MCO8590314.1 hypothetical protein [Burkholderia multivorans]MCO8632589.1 hypothetical protein [Burkholderia multivorans]MCO8647148.1 hypothetical protein [Burkholderia multivorans]